VEITAFLFLIAFLYIIMAKKLPFLKTCRPAWLASAKFQFSFDREKIIYSNR